MTPLQRSQFTALAAALVASIFSMQMVSHAQGVPSSESFLDRENGPKGRQHYEWSRLHDPATGQIPQDIRAKELGFVRGLPARPERVAGVLNKTGSSLGVQSTSWTQRGPYNVGGRTRALAIDVSNPNVILAGGVSGGMWRSTNGGTSWASVTSPGQLHSVTCITQDVRTGHTSTWYYGTGEFVGNSASSSGAPFRGDGIFKSTDNGVSWTLLSSTSTGMPQVFNSFFQYVWNLAIDPSNLLQEVIYAATYGAIFRSTNGGGSWDLLGGGTSPYSTYTDLQVTPSGAVYAGLSSDGLNAGIWRSPDGLTWTNISPSDLPATYKRILIAPAPSDQSVVYLVAETPGSGYQTTFAGENEAHSFWKYKYLSGTGTGSGGQWFNRTSNLPNLGLPVGNFASQGSYCLALKVKPDDTNAVFLGGTNLYRSTDGFASAITSTGWIGGFATVNNVSQYPNHHSDQQALAFAPGTATTLYSGNDGGIYKSTADLASPVVWTPLNNGYVTSQFFTVALDHATSGNDAIIGGTQDNGTWWSNSSLPSTPWVQILDGDGTSCAIADGRASYYTSVFEGKIFRNLLDGSGNFLDYGRVDPAGATGYLFVPPLVLDPSNNTIMYLAVGTSLWRNSDLTGIPLAGASPGTASNPTSVNWTQMTGASFGGTITALGVSRAAPAHRLYYGSDAGRVYRLDNAGAAAAGTVPVDIWTGKGLPSGYVSSIAIDPANGDNALLVFSNYSVISLYYTTDAGASWTAVAGNLEQNSDGSGNGPSVRWASILPLGATTLYYVGTSTGLYSTTPLNASSTVWTQEGASTIGNVVVDQIDTRQSDGMVVLGTHGYGVFSGIASNPLPIQIATFTATLTSNSSVLLQWFTASEDNNYGFIVERSPDAKSGFTAVSELIPGHGTSVTGFNYNFVDVAVPYGTLYYRLKQMDLDGTIHYTESVKASVTTEAGESKVPIAFALDQNYPNPFNPSTTIRYGLPNRSPVSLTVLNTLGQQVAQLLNGDMEAGYHEVKFEGSGLSSGVYFYRFQAGSFTETKRLLLLR